MTYSNFVVQSIKCYEFGKNSLLLNIVHNKQWNKYLLDITPRKFSYTNNGKTKEGSCSIYLNLITAIAFVDQLPLAYQLAKKLQDDKGVKIYNIFCLLFEICYTFPHRSAASDRERLGRLSAWGHYRSRRHRSLEYRELCAWHMRTYLRWSRSTRIWESRRRSWNPVCLKLRPCFQRTYCKRRSRDHAKPAFAQTNADQVNEGGRPTDLRTIKRFQVAKWAVSEAAAARAVGKKPKRSYKFDDVHDGGRRDVNKRNRRDLDESYDE